MRIVKTLCHSNDFIEELAENGYTYIGIDSTLTGKEFEVFKHDNGNYYRAMKYIEYPIFDIQYEGKLNWIHSVKMVKLSKNITKYYTK